MTKLPSPSLPAVAQNTYPLNSVSLVSFVSRATYTDRYITTVQLPDSVPPTPFSFSPAVHTTGYHSNPRGHEHSACQSPPSLPSLHQLNCPSPLQRDQATSTQNYKTRRKKKKKSSPKFVSSALCPDGTRQKRTSNPKQASRQATEEKKKNANRQAQPQEPTQIRVTSATSQRSAQLSEASYLGCKRD